MKNTLEITNYDLSTKQTINWELCLVCQKNTNEKLTCPANYTGHNKGAGYSTLSSQLLEFQKLNALPPSLNLIHLDDGSGVESTLCKHNAKYHKTCSLKFNKMQLNRAKKQRTAEVNSGIDDVGDSKKITRAVAAADNSSCFFCDSSASSSRALHDVCTFEVNDRVRECALNLQDADLLAKLSAGDMIATEAKYHRDCLSNLYKTDRRAKTQEIKNTETVRIQARAFAELISFIESGLEGKDKAPIFRLRNLIQLYEDRIIFLGGELSRVHSTRLKIKILNYFPELSEHADGRDVYLTVADEIGKSLRKTCDFDAESEAVILCRAAKIIRRDLRCSNNQPFNGTFSHNCQQDSVPESLMTLVSMIVNSPRIDNNDDSYSQPVLSISQLIAFNTSVNLQSKFGTQRHSQRQDVPLPLFVGTYIHSKTRSREIIETFYQAGISISYDRVLALSTQLGNSAVDHLNEIGIVCPKSMREKVFTTSAVDNIDHNPSSTSAKGSFHGTGISLFQHIDLNSNPALQQSFPLRKSNEKKIKDLPQSYTFVPPKPNINTKAPIPEVANLVIPPQCSSISLEETAWCEYVMTQANVDSPNTENEIDLHRDLGVSWAAYHSRKHKDAGSFITTSCLLPLFQEESKSVAMMCHAMNMIKKAISYVNPGQVSIMECDQPLFILAKQIQWTYPEEYGEHKFIVLLGGLHTKLAIEKCLGNMLEGTGWTAALAQAGVASIGTAESFLKGVHIKKTLRAHHVTACALYYLRKQAYQEYCNSNDGDDPPLQETNWFEVRAQESPQFFFWELILNTQLDFFTWDRSVHNGDFELYIKSLANLQWLFFALDHPNYARAVSIHLRDMLSLETKFPDVYAEFCSGKFTIKCTRRPFSRIPIDEAHEHNNAVVKGEGGAVGLTENPAALLRWMVAGPEMARLVSEFNTSMKSRVKDDENRHHDDMPTTQFRFLKDVKSLIKVLDELGNPFRDTSGDLLTLDTRKLMDRIVVDSLRHIKTLGQDQSTSFFENRLIKRVVALDDTLKRNKVLLFSRPVGKIQSRSQYQISSLKNDRQLFSRLFINCQVRDGDFKDFFRHENQSYPPALTDNSSLRFGKKSDIIDWRYLFAITPEVRRIDVIFDEYRPDSLKSTVRQKRGQGGRLRVEGDKVVPKNWSEFLKYDGNKQELFSFLSRFIVQQEYSVKVVTTHHESVLCTQPEDMQNLMPCSHEEADTRIFLHSANGAAEGYKKILIRTVDTDVVVLAVHFFNRIFCESMWVAFGVGNSFRFLNIKAYAQKLGPEKCTGLLAYHALTGCDTTSSFKGKGKRSSWAVWSFMPSLNGALISLSCTPTLQQVQEVMPSVEKFIVVLYDRCCEEETVNGARQYLVTHKGKDIENIPPTQDALHLHVLRAAYQAGHVWSQSLVKNPILPDLTNYGWIKPIPPSTTWSVKWTSLPTASIACRTLITCSCKMSCTSRCGCLKAGLPCTTLCKCGGH